MSGAAILECKENQVIVRQGDTEKSLYKVISGSVALYINYKRKDEYLVGVLSFPKCFGEITLLTGEPSYYTVVALTDVRVLRVPEANFEAFIQADPQNAMNIMKTMARNFSMVNMNMNMLIEDIREMSEEDQNLKEVLNSMMQMQNIYWSEEN